MTAFYIALGLFMGFLHAALAKQYGLKPIHGFLVGFFCPGIGMGILVFLSRINERKEVP